MDFHDLLEKLDPIIYRINRKFQIRSHLSHQIPISIGRIPLSFQRAEPRMWQSKSKVEHLAR